MIKITGVKRANSILAVFDVNSSKISRRTISRKIQGALLDSTDSSASFSYLSLGNRKI